MDLFTPPNTSIRDAGGGAESDSLLFGAMAECGSSFVKVLTWGGGGVGVGGGLGLCASGGGGGPLRGGLRFLLGPASPRCFKTPS